MNSNIIFSIVVILGIAALVALYVKTFILDRGSPSQRAIDRDGPRRGIRQRLDESEASTKKGLLP